MYTRKSGGKQKQRQRREIRKTGSTKGQKLASIQIQRAKEGRQPKGRRKNKQINK